MSALCSECFAELTGGSCADHPDDPLILDLPCPEPFDYYLTRQHLDQVWAAPRWPV